MFRRIGFFRNTSIESEVEVSESRGIRSLFLGSSTVQSSMKLMDPFELVLDYTQAMMSFMLFHNRVQSVACIGLGGGSIPKFIWKNLPDVKVCVIENSEQVINVARQYFFVPDDDERLSVIHADGLKWIAAAGQYDVIMLDAFDASGVPGGFVNDEFTQRVKSCIAQNGIYIQNLWSSDPQLKSRIFQIESYFDQIALVPTPKGGNIVALAFNSAPTTAQLSKIDQLARGLKQSLGLDFDAMLDRIRSFQSSQAKKLSI
ncbi:MAG: fused MFS/spermidine synthase [Proteobacteria bacterium]|nr:fused MFS/spermidine synthase [Pseudomonadota bacterium]MDA1330983.1 fused MFS/spermidine synthase [Pseudomonadota bacterium]